MHQSSAIQRVYYGADHVNFYLRMDFRAGVKPGVEIPNELNLAWYYPKETMHNSPIPLAELPRKAPTNYRFHHRLLIDLTTKYTWLQEAMDYDRWEARSSNALVAWDKCLEIAVPWADLNLEPDYGLQMALVFSDCGRYRQHIPEQGWISLQVP